MRFYGDGTKTAVVFVFASFYMRLNAKGIGQSHVLKLQMALKKSVSETGALPYKFQITTFFSVKGRFVSEICIKLRLNFLQTVVVR